MKRNTTPTPTTGELEILSVLWQRGPSTVKDVHEALQRTKPTLYTTVLKLMQIMAEKGLVTRDESQRAHVYKPAIAPARTQARLVQDLIDRAFGGSAAQLIMNALSSRRTSPQELQQIKELLAKQETETK